MTFISIKKSLVLFTEQYVKKDFFQFFKHKVLLAIIV